MNSIFLNHTTRIFCISGNLHDSFCTKELQLKNFEELLNEYLMNLGYQNVFFYNSTKQLVYALDEESARGLKGGRHEERKVTQISYMHNDGMTPVKESTDKEDGQKDSEVSAGSAYCVKKTESAFTKWADNVIREKKNAAIVMTSLDDYVKNGQAETKRVMSALFDDWNNLDSDNSNIFIFLEKNLDLLGISRIFSDGREWSMSSLFMDDICGNNPMLKRNACLFVSYPRYDEISSLLEYFRIIGFETVVGLDENGNEKKVKLYIDYRYNEKDELVRLISYYSRECDRNGLKMIKEAVERALLEHFNETRQERLLIDEHNIRVMYSDCNKMYTQMSTEELEALFIERTEWGNAKNVIFNFISSTEKKKHIDAEEKAELRTNMVERMEYRLCSNLSQSEVPNFVLQGPPGVGKTEIANNIGRILHAHGILRSGHTVVASRDKLVGQWVGSSAIKTSKIIEQAQEGVLLIDEVYSLAENREGSGSDSFCSEVINTLVAAMTNKEYRICFIFSGYKSKMDTVWKMNEGLFDRFGEDSIIDIPEFNEKIIKKIFLNDIEKDKFFLNDEIKKELDIFFENFYSDRNRTNYANARTVLNLAKTVKRNAINKVETDTDRVCIEKSDFGEKQALFEKRGMDRERIFESIEHYPGLKDTLEQLLLDIQAVKLEYDDKGLDYPGPMHMIWKGNPGTGKSTAAKLVAQLYHELHIFGGNEPIYVDAGTIKGKYVGSAEDIINKLMDEAKEKNTVLVIEEAYQLVDENFGNAAINAMLNRMEDDRKNFNIIFILYNEKYEDFLNLNAGLASRLMTVEFRDYKIEELMQIFDFMLEKSEDSITTEAKEKVRMLLERMDTSKGNARSVRKLIELMRQKRFARICDNGKIKTMPAEEKYCFIGSDIDKCTNIE